MTAISSPHLISLQEGQSLDVEPGGMLAYRNCAMKTNFSAKGTLEKIKRYVLGGETLFKNVFTAQKGGGWVSLEESYGGQLATKMLLKNETPLMIRRKAWVASTPNVSLTTIYQGVRGYLKGQGIAALRAEAKDGDGKIYFHAPDGIVKEFRITSSDGPVVIDNNMVLAYSENLQSTLKKPGTTKSFFFSGEGLVCEFQGNGVVYVASGEGGRKTFAETVMKETVKAITNNVITVISYAAGLAIVSLGIYLVTGQNPIRRFFHNFMRG